MEYNMNKNISEGARDLAKQHKHPPCTCAVVSSIPGKKKKIWKNFHNHFNISIWFIINILKSDRLFQKSWENFQMLGTSFLTCP